MLALGIDLGGTFARAAVVDAQGQLLAAAKIALTDRSPTGVVETITLASKQAISAAGAEDVSSCGVGVAGQLLGDRGVVALAPNLGWKDVPLGELLSKRLDRPVKLVNDLRAAAWGEFIAGAGREVQDLLVVFVGSGVGSAIISAGRIINGSSNVAGELGHIKVIPGGRLCGCGENGCLEAYAGGHNLIAQMKEAVGQRVTLLAQMAPLLTPASLVQAVEQGDEAAREIFERASVVLSVAVANYVTLLNPARVILGGGVMVHAPALHQHVARGISELTNNAARSSVQIVSAALGDDAGIIGAGLLSLPASR